MLCCKRGWRRIATCWRRIAVQQGDGSTWALWVSMVGGTDEQVEPLLGTAVPCRLANTMPVVSMYSGAAGSSAELKGPSLPWLRDREAYPVIAPYQGPRAALPVIWLWATGDVREASTVACAAAAAVALRSWASARRPRMLRGV